MWQNLNLGSYKDKIKLMEFESGSSNRNRKSAVKNEHIDALTFE